jgi:heme-degrading monooxygenase HmoA
MSVTVLMRNQALPGRGDELLSAVVRLVRERTSWFHNGGRSLRVFQSVNDPDLVLGLSEWDSRELFFARHHDESGDPIPELLTLRATPPEYNFFHTISSREIWGAHAGAVVCTLIHGTPAIRPALQEMQAAITSQPGFVSRYTYEDADDPNRFLIVHGWETLDALERARDQASPAQRRLQELATAVERFAGVTRVERDRYTTIEPDHQPADTTPA